MKASDLRGILTYIPSFRDKLFVLSVDSAVLEDERAASLFLDSKFLEALLDNGILPVVPPLGLS